MLENNGAGESSVENQSDSSQNSQSQQTNNDPAGSGAGQSSDQKPNAEVTSALPEKFKGKSVQDIVKAYSELETKLGGTAEEIKEAKKIKDEMSVVMNALWRQPELYRQVERAIQDFQQGGQLPNTRDRMGNDESNAGTRKGSTEKKDSSDDEVRTVTQNQIISGFEERTGLKKLPTEQRQKLSQKIASELAEMADPGGTLTIPQVIKKIPLPQLEKYLEKAYKLAVADRFLDQGTSLQDIGSIGGMSSGGGKADNQHGLSEKELEVARKLGISPDKYAKQKQKK